MNADRKQSPKKTGTLAVLDSSNFALAARDSVKTALRHEEDNGSQDTARHNNRMR